jgi:hypothetical protein
MNKYKIKSCVFWIPVYHSDLLLQIDRWLGGPFHSNGLSIVRQKLLKSLIFLPKDSRLSLVGTSMTSMQCGYWNWWYNLVAFCAVPMLCSCNCLPHVSSSDFTSRLSHCPWVGKHHLLPWPPPLHQSRFPFHHNEFPFWEHFLLPKLW